MSTLLLNANAVPLSFLPVSSISWQQAIKMVYLEDAEVLHSYDNWKVHSPSVTMTVPSVIILKRQEKAGRLWVAREDHNPQRNLVFLRDGFECQYCLKVFPRNKLTLDHVIPKKFGGRTTWNNISSACNSCNGKRGHDMRIQPKKLPWRPTYSELIKMMRKFPITLPDICWNYYLGWDESIVRISRPCTENDLEQDYWNVSSPNGKYCAIG